MHFVLIEMKTPCFSESGVIGSLNDLKNECTHLATTANSSKSEDKSSEWDMHARC